MIFSSYAFLLFFLPLTWLGFRIIRPRLGVRASQLWLLACSLFFYSLWNPFHLPLLVGSVVVNYGIGQLLGPEAPRRRLILTGGVVLNLGLLAYFKYAGFFVGNVVALTGRDFGFEAVALPLAISFFTFQQIAFLVGAFRGTKVPKGFVPYALFVCFFPQLIAGPIVLFRNIGPQLERLEVSSGSTARGLTLLAIGLFKKVVIADQISQFVTPAFNAASNGMIHTADAWTGMLAYTSQLYFDFSGYSDMALGLALLFGVTLPLNFDAPYRATSIAAFWQRWHITLGDFLKYFLYIPLGGSRCKTSRVLFNVLFTMTLCGLWHGAGWTFVVWGFMHGLLLAVFHAWKRSGRAPLHPVAGWLLTVPAVVQSMVLFRADSLEAAGVTYLSLVGIGSGGDIVASSAHAWILIGASAVILAFFPCGARWVRGDLPRWNWRPTRLHALAMAGLVVASILNMGKIADFLYFNF